MKRQLGSENHWPWNGRISTVTAAAANSGGRSHVAGPPGTVLSAFCTLTPLILTVSDEVGTFYR